MSPRRVSARSLIGLNAANFFQAEMIGVVLPVLNAYLREAHWRYDAIGVATAAGGLGALIFQTPAGIITDSVRQRRLLFAVTAIVTGICFGSIPLLPHSYMWIDSLLFVSEAAGTLFVPLLAALALALVGHDRLSGVMGTNQGWNHAGNIAAALGAMAVVSFFGLASVFYAVAMSSMLAMMAVFVIREDDLDEHAATGLTSLEDRPVKWTVLLRDQTVLFLFISIFLFHFANAPILPTVALYVKQLGGSDRLMTATVLTAQSVMVPVSLFAGRYCQRWGRKPVMAIAFWALPLRILSYAYVTSPKSVVWLQCLDGIGAGIYGVAVVAMAADLTHGRGRFNTMMGVFASALAVGGVIGPLVTGVLVQRVGFQRTFYVFATLALLSAVVFSALVPETKDQGSPVVEEGVAA